MTKPIPLKEYTELLLENLFLATGGQLFTLEGIYKRCTDNSPLPPGANGPLIRNLISEIVESREIPPDPFLALNDHGALGFKVLKPEKPRYITSDVYQIILTPKRATQ